MGLVDYISRQPYQKAKSITQYDEEFMVATISRIRDAITTLFFLLEKNSIQKTAQYQQTQITSKRDARPLLQIY